ncbi:MAG: hypothetical protein K2O53_05655 [Bacteroidales bacterium]|nr:hypothetical protein [Bacteroidales bacterium]
MRISENRWQDKSSDDIELKVNVIPTWKEDAPHMMISPICTDDYNDVAHLGDYLNVTATLYTNWVPTMTWQHAKTAAGPWENVVIDNDHIQLNESITLSHSKIDHILEAFHPYQSDSGYYRIALEAPAGSVCAGKSLGTSKAVYIHIDTTPQLSMSNQTLGVKIGGSEDLIVKVHNPNACLTMSPKWYVISTPGAEAQELSAFQEGDGNAFANNLDYSGNVLHVKDAVSEMNGLKVFATVENCCGKTSSDTVPITVSGELKIEAVKGDTVCEGETATLTVWANQTIKDANNRQWWYATPDKPDDWQKVPTAWPEDMVSGVAKLTVSDAPYAFDRYRFKLELTDGDKYTSDVMTLVVKPVKDLRVYIDIAPNPAHGDAPEAGEEAQNWTEMTAIIYVGDDVTELDSIDWSKVRVLTDEELHLYGDTVLDWYQILKDSETPVEAKAQDDADIDPDTYTFQAEGELHGRVLKVVNLNYEIHDLSRYYAVLRSDCAEKTSNTDTLRIYTDLLLEWAADFMYAEDTLDYGTTIDDLDKMNLPTDRVIAVKLKDPENPATKWEEKHRISSAYYIKCGDDEINDGYADLITELRKGVQSEENDDVVIATRQWFYRFGPDDEWKPLFNEQRMGTDYHGEYVFDMDYDRHDLALAGVHFPWHGMQFISKAYADSVGVDADGHAIYNYADSTPILTLVVSEPLPEDLAFEPFEDEGSCDEYNYVFKPNATHESYRYEWEIKRPGAEYQPVEGMTEQDAVYTYGPATPEDRGTVIRITLHNFCGEDMAEAEMHVMTVDIEDAPDELCADGTLDLKAIVTDGGANPAYAWYVNGTAMPDATADVFTFDPSKVTPADNGQYAVEVRVKADPTLPFVNPMACAAKTLTVHALPAKGTAKVEPESVTVVDSATLSVSVPEGSTVVWSPAEWLHNATAATTSTRPIPTSGSYDFYATVTNQYGCSITDTVTLIVASSFNYDSTEAVVVVPAFPFETAGDGSGLSPEPDTALKVVQVGDTLRITTCKNSIGLITPRTSGGDAPLVYAWEGIEPLTAAEVEDAGLSPLPDSVFAFYFDGSVAEFGCTITERGGEGLSVQMRAYVAYYRTQHVVLEAMPNMRHNRYYENQVVFFTPHPSRFDLYNYYSYTVAEDGGIDQLIDKRQTDNYLYKTDFDFEQGAERRVYVAVADRNGCRSYDSVDLTVLQLPNAMVCNDPNYPEACILFPEFQVEIHDSWGRLVKAIDDGLGWDARRGGKLVDGGTYYYTVKLPTNDGFTYVKGAVTVFNKKK